MENLFDKIDSFAREQIDIYGLPQNFNYEVANRKAEELALSCGGGIDLAKCATALMDIKLGEAVKNGKQPEHVKMSADYAQEILDVLGVEEKTKKLLVNCVLAHHGNVPYESIEAEIAANADAYRFISEIGVFTTYGFAKNLGKNHNESLDFVQFKLDEKFNMLSLEKAKEELVPLYYKLSDLIKKAHI